MEDQRTAAPPPKPEIDPEMSELEAQAQKLTGKSAARVVTERLLRTVLARKETKATPTRSAPHEKGHRDQRQRMGQGRAVRRAVSQTERTADRTRKPHARLGRAKPVKSQAQLAYEYKAAVRTELSRIKVIRLIAECPEIKFVAGVPGLKTVWQLSQAPTEWIHAIPGLGEKRRKRLHAYLVSKNVPVAWRP